MINPANLDKFLTFHRPTDHLDDAGRSIVSLTQFAARRAELVEASLVEAPQPFGENETSGLLFRLRYLDGITTNDQVRFEGRFYNIRKINEMNRRMVTEIAVEAVK